MTKAERERKKQNEHQQKFRAKVIERDHGCVWCHLGYRPWEHIPIPEFDWHLYHGKAYASCEFHAMEFGNILNVVKRREMAKLLTDYLTNKHDPEVF